MAEPKAQLIEKIASREGDLVGIYRQIYPVLEAVDRSNLRADVIASLENLDLPDSIHPAKAAAILKAILGSTDQDKFSLESCHGVKMPDGKSLGGFVGEKLREIGISYHDFWSYLRERGWLNPESPRHVP